MEVSWIINVWVFVVDKLYRSKTRYFDLDISSRGNQVTIVCPAGLCTSQEVQIYGETCTTGFPNFKNDIVRCLSCWQSEFIPDTGRENNILDFILLQEKVRNNIIDVTLWPDKFGGLVSLSNQRGSMTKSTSPRNVAFSFQQRQQSIVFDFSKVELYLHWITVDYPVHDYP